MKCKSQLARRLDWSVAGVGGPGRSVYQIIIADSSVAGGANVFPLTLALNSGRFHVRKQSARHVPPTHTADFPGRTLAVGEKKKKKTLSNWSRLYICDPELSPWIMRWGLHSLTQPDTG